MGRFVRMIEEIALQVLAALGVPKAGRIKGFTGLWMQDSTGAAPEKICAIGVRIRRWVSMHGFALNLRGDLEGFDWIVPCGLEDKGVTSIERISSFIAVTSWSVRVSPSSRTRSCIASIKNSEVSTPISD